MIFCFFSLQYLKNLVLSRLLRIQVFHMEEAKRKTDSIEHKVLGGYHLLSDEHYDENKVYQYGMESIAPNVCEGYIVKTTEHLPVYKTFSDRFEMIQCLRDALENIETVEDQNAAVWLIKGISKIYPLQITLVVRKNLELVTFYPTSFRSKESIKSFQQGVQSIFRRYFFNPCYVVPSVSDNNSDASTLHHYFGSNGIDVRLKFVHLDAKSIDNYLIFGVYFRSGSVRDLQTPDMKYGLLPDSIINTILHDFDNVHKAYRKRRLTIQRYLRWYHKKVSFCHKRRVCRRLQQQFDRLKIQLAKDLLRCSLIESLPSRQVKILGNLDKIHLPIETIQQVFFDANSRWTRFPSCLTRCQILDKLKEAISNFLQLMHEDFQETKEKDWEDIDLSKFWEPTKEDKINYLLGPSWLPVERDSILTGTEWDYFGGPVDPPTDPVLPHNKYALEMMHHRLCRHGNFSLGDLEHVPSTIPIPDIGIHTNNQQIAFLRLFSNGTCFMDTWEFIVHLDLSSGNIVDFRMPLCNIFNFHAMKPTLQLSSA